MNRAVTDKADAIKSAAKELFASQGYAATTTRQIASAVSMEAGSLYYHFDSKNEILALILSEGNERLLKAADEIVTAQPEDPVEALRLLIRAHVRILAEDPALFMVLTRELSRLEGVPRTEIIAQRTRYERIFQDLLRKAVAHKQLRPCNVKVVSYGIIGLLNSVAMWFNPRGPLSLDRIVDEYIEMLLDGLRI